MEESNPFLGIARAFQIPYGEVLCFADAYKKKFTELNYWEIAATKKLQGTPVARAIINKVNWISYTSIYIGAIKNDGGLFIKDFAPFEAFGCVHNGKLYGIRNMRCLFKGVGDRVSVVRIGWNDKKELIVLTMDNEIRYAICLVSYDGDKVILGDASLFPEG